MLKVVPETQPSARTGGSEESSGSGELQPWYLAGFSSDSHGLHRWAQWRTHVNNHYIGMTLYPESQVPPDWEILVEIDDDLSTFALHRARNDIADVRRATLDATTYLSFGIPRAHRRQPAATHGATVRSESLRSTESQEVTAVFSPEHSLAEEIFDVDRALPVVQEVTKRHVMHEPENGGSEYDTASRTATMVTESRADSDTIIEATVM